MQAIDCTMGFLQDSEIWFLVSKKYNEKSLIGVAISEDGVLGLVNERGLRQGSVRAEELNKASTYIIVSSIVNRERVAGFLGIGFLILKRG